jgi:hypothetical protein
MKIGNFSLLIYHKFERLKYSPLNKFLYEKERTPPVQRGVNSSNI